MKYRLSALAAAGALVCLAASGHENQPLDRALDSVQPERISSDLHFIASDEMKGRDTPSEGLKIAARFIRNRLQRLGFQPGAGDKYLYGYDLSRRAVDASITSVTASRGDQSIDLTYGEDYFFHMFSAWPALTEGEVVWMGDLREANYEGIDLNGKWVFGTVSGNSRGLTRDVGRTGAAGLILTQAADTDEEPWGTSLKGWIQMNERGRVSWPSSQGGNRGRSGSLAELRMTRPAAERILALHGNKPEPGTALGVTVKDVRNGGREGGLPLTLENVCGFWPGSDAELSKEVIIVSAHYDHVGARDNGDIYNGADDNGSGTCGLLSLAEALHHYGPMRRSVLLIWVSGEEKGLYGSKAWSENPSLAEGYRAIANLNIDMIGRNPPEQLMITPSAKHEKYNRLTLLATDCAKLEGFPALGSADAYYGRSDQAMFARMGIPIAFLFSGEHEDYHKPTDTPDKIDYDKIHRVVRTVMRMLDQLQVDELELEGI